MNTNRGGVKTSGQVVAVREGLSGIEFRDGSRTAPDIRLPSEFAEEAMWYSEYTAAIDIDLAHVEVAFMPSVLNRIQEGIGLRGSCRYDLETGTLQVIYKVAALDDSARRQLQSYCDALLAFLGVEERHLALCELRVRQLSPEGRAELMAMHMGLRALR